MVRSFVNRHWPRALIIRDQFQLSGDASHLLLATIIGIFAGLSNLAYFQLNKFFKVLVLGSTEDLIDIAEAMNGWQRVLVPTVGGLSAGLVLYLGLRLLGNPGRSNLLEVVVAGDGRLSLRTAALNGLSSLISVSSGASIGREGMLIQISATLASKLGQLFGWPPFRLRVMVACGAAAGMAAGFNAPIAGAVFAAQIVLGNFSMRMFAPLVVSSVVAAVLSRTFFGIHPWYLVPDFDFDRLTQLPWFLVLGMLSGAMGAVLVKALSASEQLFNRLPVPLYARLALAGLIVGGIAQFFPEVWGNGYSATNRILQLSPSIQFVLCIFAAKFVATVVTVGSGTVGGVFTPTLFLGAAFGSIFGHTLHLVIPNEALPTGAFALVGMGSMLAATTHSSLLAMLVIFELSLNYSLMPPLMLACVVATLVARSIHPESIYSEPLLRKGLALDRERTDVGAVAERIVADLMHNPVPPLDQNTIFPEIARRFLGSPYNFLPVVDPQQTLVGVVSLHDLKEFLNAGQEFNSVIASDVMRERPPFLTPNQRLAEALPIFLKSELRNVPVVNNPLQLRLIGSVSREEALGMLADAISGRGAAEAKPR